MPNLKNRRNGMKVLIDKTTKKVITVSGNAMAVNHTANLDIARTSTLTQAQYDALATKVEDTLYLISGTTGYVKAYLGETPLYMLIDSSKRKTATATGTAPITFTTLDAGIVVSLIRYGKCEQESTPTMSSPVNIKCNNGLLKWDSSNNRIYADGTPEAITLGAQTATVENLLAIGNFIDEQDIISGAISRNVGVKVFNGTETFVNNILTNCWALNPVLGVGAPSSRRVICTHFDGADSLPAAGSRQGYALIGLADNSTSYTVGFGATATYSTETAFKNWLASQYAAGTPVIVVYPLLETATESTTPQSLDTAKGSNTVSSTANTSSPQITITYQE